MTSEFERHLLSSSSYEFADEFINTQATDDHILEGRESAPLSNSVDAQLNQEWLNLDEPAQKRRKIQDFREKRKTNISSMIKNTIPVNEAVINDTVTNFCKDLAVLKATLGLHFGDDHDIRLINNSKEKKLMIQTERKVKIEDHQLGRLTFKRPGAANWSKGYENDLCKYAESQNEFATFMQNRITIIKKETSRFKEIKKCIDGIKSQIDFVNGKLVGMDAQMFQPDCLSFSGEIRKQQIIEDTEAATRVIQDNIDIDGLIQIMGTFILSKVKLLGLLEEELEEKNTREKSLRKCFDQNLNYHFQSTT